MAQSAQERAPHFLDGRVDALPLVALGFLAGHILPPPELVVVRAELSEFGEDPDDELLARPIKTGRNGGTPWRICARKMAEKVVNHRHAGPLGGVNDARLMRRRRAKPYERRS